MYIFNIHNFTVIYKDILKLTNIFKLYSVPGTTNNIYIISSTYVRKSNTSYRALQSQASQSQALSRWLKL